MQRRQGIPLQARPKLIVVLAKSQSLKSFGKAKKSLKGKWNQFKISKQVKFHQGASTAIASEGACLRVKKGVGMPKRGLLLQESSQVMAF